MSALLFSIAEAHTQHMDQGIYKDVGCGKIPTAKAANSLHTQAGWAVR